ncbi:MAG: 7,8-didemethyl-8-hydroxy-5-deazariboflavin synthase subunit CofH [Hadesarchaea archaeon]|nr:7,8-didemethyl-8-hydroxy-5-deazariboflavin synthase subunit CofH [Hadesarchaea archaeon]
MTKSLENKNQDFNKILKKALDGSELSVSEGERLLKCSNSELKALVETADNLRREKVGDIVTYVVNRNINFTNVCETNCKFCAFHSSPNDSKAYLLSTEEIKSKVSEALDRGATEICLQGGLHPSLELRDYVSFLEAIRSVSNEIHVHAYSPAEINHVAQAEDMRVREVIIRLKEAGLDSIPGTAAEILVNRVRNIICPRKISAEDWERIIRTSHQLGVPTTATIMYGHVENPWEVSFHLSKLRSIQKETQGFTELVPLAFASGNTELEKMGKAPKLTPKDHLRIHSVARLMLNGFIDNIQSSWVKLGPKLAQRVLNAGANDLSGTLIEENITRAAGGQMQEMAPKELKELINEVDRTPRERTTTYKLIK